MHFMGIIMHSFKLKDCLLLAVCQFLPTENQNKMWLQFFQRDPDQDYTTFFLESVDVILHILEPFVFLQGHVFFHPPTPSLD